MAEAEHGQPTRKRTKSRIPRFTRIEEAAEFWDTHDSAEFENQFETVDDVRFVVLRGEPAKSLTVRLPEDALAQLTAKANELGIDPSTLVRMWVLDQLRAQQKTGAT
jgi:hypothetical protein